MSQLPILRKAPEGGQKHLLSLTISHPMGAEPPQIDFFWDGEFVVAHRLPPAFAQSIFNGALQTLFMGAVAVLTAALTEPPVPVGEAQKVQN